MIHCPNLMVEIVCSTFCSFPLNHIGIAILGGKCFLFYSILQISFHLESFYNKCAKFSQEHYILNWRSYISNVALHLFPAKGCLSVLSHGHLHCQCIQNLIRKVFSLFDMKMGSLQPNFGCFICLAKLKSESGE